MNESVSYTVTLNFVIVFIVIVFAFLSATLVYYKSNKIGNVIINSIEKYEGYNVLAEEDAYRSLVSIGYNMSNVACPETVASNNDSDDDCIRVDNPELNGNGQRGYCVYLCNEENFYYYYKVRTTMAINIPIIQQIMSLPVFTNTNRMYDYENSFKYQNLCKKIAKGEWIADTCKCSSGDILTTDKLDANRSC